jgi:hypothetical protein
MYLKLFYEVKISDENGIFNKEYNQIVNSFRCLFKI